MSVESTYADLEVHIRRREERGYPVEITLNRALEFRTGYLDPEILDWVPAASLPQSGQGLFRRLLASREVRTAWAEVQGRFPRRRIRLRIAQDAPELHTIPWELLREEKAGDLSVGLAAADATPFSRYLAGTQAYGTPISTRPIRILVAIANPDNLEEFSLSPIQVEEEWASLQEALAGLSVKLVQLPQPCTPEALEAALREGAHILHFIGHGVYREAGGEAVLFMADQDNQVRRVGADEQASMLARQLADVAAHEEDGLRLVFLASCQTATTSPADAYRGFAPKLVAAGVPAVLAMQDLVPVDTARDFTQIFYRQLLQHGQVDLAGNQARAALLTADRPGAHIPVLFMRLESGALLAPHPVRTALEAIRNDEQYAFFSGQSGEYLPLPLEAVHLTGHQDLHGFDETETQATAANDMLTMLRGILGRPPEPQGDAQAQPRLVLVTGGFGCNKSTQLRRIIWETSQESLQSGDPDLVLPVYVDLQKFPTMPRTLRNPVQELILEGLKPYWPDLTASELVRLLEEDYTLCLLFDHSEYLTSRQQRRVCERIAAFMKRHPRHQYVLSADAAVLCQEPFEEVDLQILVIQPLERRKIRHCLQGLPEGDPGGEPLLQSLDQSGLYDLASVPWFLLKMVQRARSGRLPESRAQVVQQMIGDAVATVPAGQGMQAHAEEVLYALAWRMQSTLATTLPLTEAFEIMSRVRGSREYSLEEFYAALVRSRLLARMGPDSLRFTYSRFQAYCCAQAIVRRPDRGQILDEITASLGRLTRLRWWEETLLFVSGLLADDEGAQEQFLKVLVYGADLLESEQSFLAARCLMESKQHLEPEPGERSTDGLHKLEEQVTAALVWRLSSRNEPRAVHRSRAALLLGQLAPPSAIEHLARTAYGRPRRDRHGEPDFDYSDVRMAAIIGLLRMTHLARERLLETIDPTLVELLHLWQNEDVPGLIRWLHTPEDPSARSIAALALGDLHGQLVLAEGKREAGDVLRELAGVFLSTETDEATLWAVTYALAMIDLPIVREAVFLPFFEQEAELFADEDKRVLHYKCMAYLIGLLRWQEQQAYDFLVEKCLKEARRARLAGVAIQALGSLADQRYKVLLEVIALGWFSQVAPNIDAPEASFSYLQRKAIDALAKVGDLETVAALREHRDIEAMGRSAWDPALEKALYRTTEEIFWRLNWSAFL